mgnify:CR=1 FL=1|tara:strand:+ start:1153 stop:1473 length:321 start_codon:yes stop_codon:yes gene_type:complete
MSKKLIFAFIQLFIFGSFIFPSEFSFPGAVMRPWEASVTVEISTTTEVKYDFDIILVPERMEMRKAVNDYLNPIVLLSDVLLWNDCSGGKWDVHEDGSCLALERKW